MLIKSLVGCSALSLGLDPGLAGLLVGLPVGLLHAAGGGERSIGPGVTAFACWDPSAENESENVGWRSCKDIIGDTNFRQLPKMPNP